MMFRSVFVCDPLNVLLCVSSLCELYHSLLQPGSSPRAAIKVVPTIYGFTLDKICEVLFVV